MGPVPSGVTGWGKAGYRGIDELPGSPLVATNAGGLVPLAAGVAARRREANASFNFALTSA
jgi:hypothetical protein